MLFALLLNKVTFAVRFTIFEATGVDTEVLVLSFLPLDRASFYGLNLVEVSNILGGVQAFEDSFHII